MKLSMIKDSKTLDKAIVSELTLYVAQGERLHGLAVSAIAMVARSGQVGPLNRLYEGLRPNDKQAFQLYLRRAHVINGLGGKNPDGLNSEIIKDAEKAGAVVARKDKKFVVTRGHTSPEAKSLLALCENRFLNPDGETDKMVFDRNNMAEVKLLGDTSFLDKVIKIRKEILEGDTDTREIHVSEPVKKFFNQMADKAELMKNQLSLASKEIVRTKARSTKTSAPVALN